MMLIGMAVGVDYSLFYLKREREERAEGQGRADALEIAAATSGRAVLISGLTVMVAPAGMFLLGDAEGGAIAVGSILVVGVAVLGSLTVLPAVLAKLGDRVHRSRIPVLRKLRRQRGLARLGLGPRPRHAPPARRACVGGASWSPWPPGAHMNTKRSPASTTSPVTRSRS